MAGFVEFIEGQTNGSFYSDSQEIKRKCLRNHQYPDCCFVLIANIDGRTLHDVMFGCGLGNILINRLSMNNQTALSLSDSQEKMSVKKTDPFFVLLCCGSSG